MAGKFAYRYEVTMCRNGEFRRFFEHHERRHSLSEVRACVIAKYVKKGWALVSCIPCPEGSLSRLSQPM